MTELESKWVDVVKSWRLSGLSQREYCRRHGHVATQLSYWQRRLCKELELSPKESFIELKRADELNVNIVELEFPNGLLLRMRG